MLLGALLLARKPTLGSRTPLAHLRPQSRTPRAPDSGPAVRAPAIDLLWRTPGADPQSTPNRQPKVHPLVFPPNPTRNLGVGARAHVEVQAHVLRPALSPPKGSTHTHTHTQIRAAEGLRTREGIWRPETRRVWLEVDRRCLNGLKCTAPARASESGNVLTTDQAACASPSPSKLPAPTHSCAEKLHAEPALEHCEPRGREPDFPQNNPLHRPEREERGAPPGPRHPTHNAHKPARCGTSRAEAQSRMQEPHRQHHPNPCRASLRKGANLRPTDGPFEREQRPSIRMSPCDAPALP